MLSSQTSEFTAESIITNLTKNLPIFDYSKTHIFLRININIL